MMVVMMVVVVVMMVPVAPDHDHGPTRMCVVMVVVMVGLGELNGALGTRRRSFIHCLECRGSVRNRLQQIGIGIGLQHVGRRGGGSRRRLYRA